MEIFEFAFMQHAVIAGVLVSITAGIIGTLVVVNRMVFLAGGIAHAAYGGVGIAIYFSLPVLLITGVFSIFIALLLAFITYENRHRTDSIIGLIWSVGMAAGIILVDLTPGYQSDLMSYLFGSILAVPKSDLWLMGILLFLIIVMMIRYYREFLAVSYDPEFAKLRGVPVRLIYTLMLVMASITVVMAIQVVGLIMVIALLTIPTYIAEKFSKTLAQMMFLSALFSFLFTMVGLWLSYSYNLTSGASIILVAALSLGLVTLIRRIIN
jgi:zinc transport system permease protein